MREKLIIVIADKNTHVRELIKRELSEEGYIVYPVKNCKEIAKLNHGNPPMNLLIIDPDLPDMDEYTLFEILHNRMPDLPIIIHTYLSDDADRIPVVHGAVYIEKNAESIDNLIATVNNKLKDRQKELA